MGSTRRNIVTLAVACAVIAGFGSIAAINATTASASGPTPPFHQCPHVGAALSCNILIELDASGGTVVDDNSQVPYDNSEDTLVGVQNDSSVAVSSLPLVAHPAAEPAFGFDGDGPIIQARAHCGGGARAGAFPGSA